MPNDAARQRLGALKELRAWAGRYFGGDMQRGTIALCDAEIERLEARDAAGNDHPDKNLNLLELAWGIIANAGGGNWETQTPEWQEAAARWRDQYHELPPAERYEALRLTPNDTTSPLTGDAP